LKKLARVADEVGVNYGVQSAECRLQICRWGQLSKQGEGLVGRKPMMIRASQTDRHSFGRGGDDAREQQTGKNWKKQRRGDSEPVI
jgi:hypothetical protein